MSKIRIINPRSGSSRYTSASQAERYVRRGEAVLIGAELTFLSHVEQRHMRNIEATLGIGRQASDIYVRGMVYWNGARSRYDAHGNNLAMFPPCYNVVYPKAWSQNALRRFGSGGVS